MIVTELQIRNFRNYPQAKLTLSPGINLISGDNAQGKTNLLESLVYLSLTRSWRTNEDRLLIRNGCEFANLSCMVQNRRQIRLDAVIHSSGKTLSVNRSPVKKTSEFVGLLNTVLFSPDDLGIFLDAPRDRRRLLDQEITKVSPGYLYALRNYRSLLKDRNSLLKQIHPDEKYLDVLDQRMVQESMAIIQERNRFFQIINSHLPKFYQTISGSETEAEIRYLSCVRTASEEALEKLYQDSRQKDLEFHSTSCGVHREDIVFILNGQNVTSTASQGQKRMILLGFKLAILKYIETISSEKAVLLLDDVLSELDRERQKKLMDLIEQPYQCVITGTEFPAFLRSGNPREFYINNGTIQGGSV